MDKNKFCIRLADSGSENYDTARRNANKLKVNISETFILIVIPRKDMTFVQPIGCTKNVSPKDSPAWFDQENTLDVWNRLFFLSKMASSSDTVNPQDFKSLEDFNMKSSLHKNPTKKKKS